MKRVTFFLTLLVFVVFTLGSDCGLNDGSSSSMTNQLDLKALGELAKNSQTAEHFEQKLNEPDGINNVDLNDDGIVDFLKVTEYGGSGSAYGFSITTETGPNQVQEIAKVEIENESTDAQTARVQVEGDKELYGSTRYESSTFSLTDILILNYLLNTHTAYSSPYYYNSYPSYYSRPGIRSHDVYRSKVGSTGTNFKGSRETTLRTQAKSPNAGKSIPPVTRAGSTNPGGVKPAAPGPKPAAPIARPAAPAARPMSPPARGK